MASPVPGNKLLDTALADFRSKLTSEEEGMFRAIQITHDTSSAVALTAQLDQAAAKRKGRCVASRLSALLASVQQFSRVVDTFVSSNPATAALIWGSVELMLRLANNSFSYFDKLSTFLMGLEKYCPRFSEYQLLYQDSARLQHALCEFYAEVVRCCTHVCEVHRSPTWLTHVRSAWMPFESEFNPFKLNLERLAREVKGEINLAETQAVIRERAEQELYRQTSRLALVRNECALRDAEERRLQRSKLQQISERRSALNRLSTYNFETAYRQACLKRHRGTAEWLTDDPGFRGWDSAMSSSILWLSGKLGCGKTVLVANTIQRILSRVPDKDTCTTYFLCRFDEETSLSASTIIRSLVRQTLQPETLSADVEALLVKLHGQFENDKDILCTLLKTASSKFLKLYIIIDGIDECGEREQRQLFWYLDSVVSNTSNQIKVMISSRNSSPPQFRDLLYPLHNIRVENNRVDHDIAMYVSDILGEKIQNREISIGNPSLVSQISDALRRGAQGMWVNSVELSFALLTRLARFLWVQYQLDEICVQKSDYEICEVLEHLPRDLEGTYSRIFKRILDNRNAELAKIVFRFAAVAMRPLTLWELREAMAVQPYSTSSEPERRINDIERLSSWCGGLIVVEEINDEVHFAHPTIIRVILRQSARDNNFWARIDLGDASYRLGEICVTYLNFNDFRTELMHRSKARDVGAETIVDATLSTAATQSALAAPFKHFSKFRKGRRRLSDGFSVAQQLASAVSGYKGKIEQSRDQQHPFLAYAKEHWLSHSSNFGPSERIWPLWSTLLAAEDGLSARPWSISDWAERSPSLCRYIAEEDQLALFDFIQESARPFTTERLRWILHVGERSGKVRITAVVLQLAVDLESDRRLLLSQAMKNLALIEYFLRIMLRVEDDVIGDVIYEAVSHVTSEKALAEALQALKSIPEMKVPQDAVFTRRPLRFRNKTLALAVCCTYATLDEPDDPAALQGLPENSFSEDATPRKPDKDNGRDKFGYTSDPLTHAVVANEYHAILACLLCGPWKIDLHMSSESSLQASESFRQAIEHDDAGMTAGTLAHTPLHHLERVVNAQNIKVFDDRPALALAVEHGHLRIVKILLVAGADPKFGFWIRTDQMAIESSSADGYSRWGWKLPFTYATPLHLASRDGRLDIVEVLLAAGASVEGKNLAGEDPYITVLEAAAQNGQDAVVAALLQAGADVNARSHVWEARTALEAACENGHFEIATMLLAAGAVIEVGRTSAFANAARRGYVDIVILLLKAVESADHSHRQLLYESTAFAAVTADQHEVARLVDASAKDAGIVLTLVSR